MVPTVQNWFSFLFVLFVLLLSLAAARQVRRWLDEIEQERAGDD